MSPAMPIAIGTTIGPYQIVRFETRRILKYEVTAGLKACTTSVSSKRFHRG